MARASVTSCHCGKGESDDSSHTICSRWVQALEGTFYRVDGACVTTWIFEGGAFRVLRGAPLPVPGSGRSQADCGSGSRLESGSFKVQAVGNLHVVTLAYAYPSTAKASAVCRTRSFSLFRDCQSKLILRQLSQGKYCSPIQQETVLSMSGVPLSWEGQTTAESDALAGRGAIVLPGTLWTGTIALHTTNCSIDVEWTTISNGLYGWQANVFDCHIGPDLAIDENPQRRALSPSSMRKLTPPGAQRGFPEMGHEHGTEGLTIIAAEELRGSHHVQEATSPCCSDLARKWRHLTMSDDSEGLKEHVSKMENINKSIFDAKRHNVRDVVHPQMCLQNYILNESAQPPGMAEMYTSLSFFPPVRRPTWSDFARMPRNDSYAACSVLVPAGCHPNASCIVQFQSAEIIRDADNADPSNSYMQDCVDRTDGVPVRLRTGVKWEDTGRTKPTKGQQLHNFWLSSALAANITEFSFLQWQAFGIAALGYDDYVEVGDSYFKPNADVLQLTQQCLSWNTTIACVCDRGFVGNGKCCEDRQECWDGDAALPLAPLLLSVCCISLLLTRCSQHDFTGSHNCHPDATCTDCWTKEEEYLRECEADAETIACRIRNPFVCDSTAGSFACLCDEGYFGTGTECYDFDECRNGTHNCYRS